jgi:bifunctional non-homologous end joining protein LigD
MAKPFCSASMASRISTGCSRKHDEEVQFYAFDALMADGDDLRKLPLSTRKTNLARLLAQRPDGIFVGQFEQGEIGSDLFRAACRFGLEGLVSKHRDRGYRAGTSPNWVKGQGENPKHPAMTRVKEQRLRPMVGMGHKARRKYADNRS